MVGTIAHITQLIVYSTLLLCLHMHATMLYQTRLVSLDGGVRPRLLVHFGEVLHAHAAPQRGMTLFFPHDSQGLNSHHPAQQGVPREGRQVLWRSLLDGIGTLVLCLPPTRNAPTPHLRTPPPRCPRILCERVHMCKRVMMSRHNCNLNLARAKLSPGHHHQSRQLPCWLQRVPALHVVGPPGLCQH